MGSEARKENGKGKNKSHGKDGSHKKGGKRGREKGSKGKSYGNRRHQHEASGHAGDYFHVPDNELEEAGRESKSREQGFPVKLAMWVREAGCDVRGVRMLGLRAWRSRISASATSSGARDVRWPDWVSSRTCASRRSGRA